MNVQSHGGFVVGRVYQLQGNARRVKWVFRNGSNMTSEDSTPILQGAKLRLAAIYKTYTRYGYNIDFKWTDGRGKAFPDGRQDLRPQPSPGLLSEL